MGSLLAALEDKLPQLYSHQQYEKLVKSINQISCQLAKPLKVHLVINVTKLKFNYNNWKCSTVRATLGIYPKAICKKELRQQQELSQNLNGFTYKKIYNLVLTIRQLYQINDFLKLVKKDNIRQTPRTPSSAQYKQCEICYAQIADLALPCGHIFGAKCINEYVIKKEERICPMCRCVFPGSRSQVQRGLFVVIDEDDSIYDQVRECLLEKLRQDNEKNIAKAILYLSKEENIPK